MHRYLGIAAYSGPPSDYLKQASMEFLEVLALCMNPSEVVIIVGGYWGLMRYIVDEGLKLGFKVVIIPPLEMEDVRFPLDSIVIRPGVSFRVRSIFLVRTSEVLVVLGGASGTIQEVITAYTEGIPVFILGMTGLPSDKLSVFTPYVDERRLSTIKIVNDPKSLANEVCNYFKRTKPRGYGGESYG